jgi:hypothetical protein
MFGGALAVFGQVKGGRHLSSAEGGVEDSDMHARVNLSLRGKRLGLASEFQKSKSKSQRLASIVLAEI